MTEQLRRPTDQVEVYWFSKQPNDYVTDQDLEQYDSGQLGFPNTHFDPDKSHGLILRCWTEPRPRALSFQKIA